MEKICKETHGCRRLLPISEFGKWGGRTSSYCKSCVRKNTKARYERSRDPSKGRHGLGGQKINGFHKHSDEQINTVLEMIERGESYYSVAKYLNRLPRTIYYWRDSQKFIPKTVEVSN
jgi:hypothetical protein